jgi:sarcosine oxidase subunit beta
MAGVAHRVGTKALLQEIHHVHQPHVDGGETPALMMADDDLGFYVRPDVGNTMLIGSIDPECDPLVYVDPDANDLSLSDEQWTTQTLRASRRMPTLGVPHQRRGLVGVYDLSDDWQPVLDRSDLDGYFMAIGSSGNMFKNAALAGHLMAELITAVEAGHDHDREPLHVTGRYTGCDLDLGLYSRNRNVSSNTALSVVG